MKFPQCFSNPYSSAPPNSYSHFTLTPNVNQVTYFYMGVDRRISFNYLAIIQEAFSSFYIFVFLEDIPAAMCTGLSSIKVPRKTIQEALKGRGKRRGLFPFL